MPERIDRDALRQGANVVGALLLIVVAVLTRDEVPDLANRYRSLLLPAGWAFAIWGVIFALAVAYAVYQALPANRTDALLRRIGWLTAAALLGSALWEVFFPAGWFVLAQLTIAAVFVALAVAFLRFVDMVERADGRGAERWLIAPFIGLFLGWITAATLVGLATTLVASGWDGDGLGAAIGGGCLVLLGAGIATALVLAGKRGPVPGWVGLGAAVLWALLGVAANQYDDSLLTTGAAIVAMVALGIVLLGRVPGRLPRTPSGDGSA